MVDKPMTKEERAEIRRIIKGRFELIRGQTAQRGREINGMIRDSLIEEHDDSLATARRESKKLERRLRSIVQDIGALHGRMESEGIQAPYSCVSERKDLRSEVNRIIGYYLKGWSPKDLSGEVQRRRERLDLACDTSKLNLRHDELTLLEQLAAGNIGSSEAKTFLDRIPTVDTFLELPSKTALKELTAKS